jgi:hypothetical protein
MMARFMLHLHQQVTERPLTDNSHMQLEAELVFAPLTTTMESQGALAFDADAIDGLSVLTDFELDAINVRLAKSVEV